MGEIVSAQRKNLDCFGSIFGAVLLLGGALPLLVATASAESYTISSGWSSQTRTKSPNIVSGLNTNFTGYTSGPWPYSLYSFTVDTTGTYTAASTTTPVVNTTFFLTGLFSPSLTTPSTPISNFFVSDFNSTNTTNFPALSLTAGTTYSVLIAYNNGTFEADSFSLTLSGPGCIAIDTHACYVDTQRGYYSPADSAAAGSTVTFNGGTLRFSAATTTGQSFSLLATGGTIDANGNLVTLTGVVTGPGTLTLASSAAGGTIVLSGANTYTGGTVINSGTVGISADNNLGAGGTSVTLNGGTLQITSSLTTNRPIIINGTGTIGTTANTTTTFSGTLSGGGGLTKTDGGTLVLSGTNTYTGTTAVNGGTLQVDGSVAGPVQVAGGATLGGDGVIGGPTAVSGTLKPGDSPGTLTFTAPVTLDSGSTLQLDIDGTGTGTGAGNYSRVLVLGAGNAFAAAGTVQPVLRGITGSASNTYTPPLGQSFQVVSADGGVTGSFSGLSQPAGLAAGTRMDALYGPTTIALVVTPASYGNLALAGLPESGSESAVGRGLDASRPAAGVRMSTGAAALYYPLYRLPGAAIPAALDQLAPNIYGDGLMASRETWYEMAEVVGNQLAGRRSGGAMANTAPGPHGATVWVSGIGQFANVSGSGAPSFNSTFGGAMAGIDYPVLPGATLGVAVGGGSLHTSDSNATDSGTAVQFALYGNYQAGRFFVDAQGGYMHVDQDVQRNLSFWNSAARGTGGVNGGGIQLHTGMHLVSGRWQVEPTLGLSTVALNAGGVSESTGGSLAERIASQSITSVESFAGVRVGTEIAVTPTVPLRVHGVIGWVHEYGDTTANTTASLQLAGVGSFGVGTAAIARNAARLGIGADMPVSPRVALYAAYDATVGRDSTAQYLTGGLRVTW